jgi:hypothetical protein
MASLDITDAPSPSSFDVHTFHNTLPLLPTQAYLFAAVIDPATGEELPGFGVEEAHVLMNVDGLRLPLQVRVW